MKKNLVIPIILLLVFAFSLPAVSQASSLTSTVSGRVLLQVQENGETWYVNPVNNKRYFFGNPTGTFQIMKKFGLGINNANFDALMNKPSTKYRGRIFIKVEDHGKAYYVNPQDLSLNYLGTPATAYSVMRGFGLGITNENLEKIPVGIITE